MAAAPRRLKLKTKKVVLSVEDVRRRRFNRLADKTLRKCYADRLEITFNGAESVTAWRVAAVVLPHLFGRLIQPALEAEAAKLGGSLTVAQVTAIRERTIYTADAAARTLKEALLALTVPDSIKKLLE